VSLSYVIEGRSVDELPELLIGDSLKLLYPSPELACDMNKCSSTETGRILSTRSRNQRTKPVDISISKVSNIVLCPHPPVNKVGI
jgi:hypothetical protein